MQIISTLLIFDLECDYVYFKGRRKKFWWEFKARKFFKIIKL